MQWQTIETLLAQYLPDLTMARPIAVLTAYVLVSVGKCR